MFHTYQMCEIGSSNNGLFWASSSNWVCGCWNLPNRLIFESHRQSSPDHHDEQLQRLSIPGRGASQTLTRGNSVRDLPWEGSLLYRRGKQNQSTTEGCTAYLSEVWNQCLIFVCAWTLGSHQGSARAVDRALWSSYQTVTWNRKKVLLNTLATDTD